MERAVLLTISKVTVRCISTDRYILHFSGLVKHGTFNPAVCIGLQIGPGSACMQHILQETNVMM